MAVSFKDAISGNGLLTAIMYVLIGIVMLAYGNRSINFIFWISGFVMVVIGVLQTVLRYVDIKGGLMTIIVGAILLVIGCYEGIAKFLVGIILIFSALPALGAASNGMWERFGIGAIDSGSATVNRIIGVILLVLGICLIIGLVFSDANNIASFIIRVGGAVILVLGLLNVAKSLK